jgi:hypothetical protein
MNYCIIGINNYFPLNFKGFGQEYRKIDVNTAREQFKI